MINSLSGAESWLLSLGNRHVATMLKAIASNLVGLNSTTLTRWPTLQAKMLGLTQCTNCVSKQRVGPIHIYYSERVHKIYL